MARDQRSFHSAASAAGDSVAAYSTRFARASECSSATLIAAQIMCSTGSVMRDRGSLCTCSGIGGGAAESSAAAATAVEAEAARRTNGRAERGGAADAAFEAAAAAAAPGGAATVERLGRAAAVDVPVGGRVRPPLLAETFVVWVAGAGRARGAAEEAGAAAAPLPLAAALVRFGPADPPGRTELIARADGSTKKGALAAGTKRNPFNGCLRNLSPEQNAKRSFIPSC